LRRPWSSMSSTCVVVEGKKERLVSLEGKKEPLVKNKNKSKKKSKEYAKRVSLHSVYTLLINVSVHGVG